jgi:acyl-coenzyme A thioesterase PaaI-like protein
VDRWYDPSLPPAGATSARGLRAGRTGRPIHTHESWRTRLARWGFNLVPAFRGTGSRLTYIASDWREVRVRLPLNWRTRNYVGTIFGGSLYGALDPIFMIMLMKILGPGYIVWDKAANIRFLRPGRETLYATFRLDEAELASIRAAVDERGKIEWRTTVELANAAGVVHASCEKVLSIRLRDGAPRPGPAR